MGVSLYRLSDQPISEMKIPSEHVGPRSRLDPFASLRPSGVEAAAGDAAGGGEAGDRQFVDDPALSWLAHGVDDDAWENCQQELGVGGEDPLGDQRGCGGRQWW